MKLEEWKEVKDYEGIYEVSNFGRVRGIDRYNHKNTFIKGKLMKFREDKDGYYRINLSKDGKKKHWRVNRLVALAFIDNPEDKPVVNHKDGDKKNNHVDNLEWCTRSENDLHAFKTGLRIPYNGGTNKRVAKVDPYTKEIIHIYDSLTEAGKLHNISMVAISHNANGLTKLTQGYEWIFVDEGVTTIENII